MKNMTIYCKDFDLTSAIKDYLTDKMGVLNKFLNLNISAIKLFHSYKLKPF